MFSVVVVFRLFLLLLAFLSEGSATVLNFVNKVAVIFRLCFFFQAEDGIRDVERSRGLGDVYKRQSPFPKFTGIS